MNLKKAIQVLKDHAEEEIRIHQEVFSEAKDGVKDLVQNHLKETMSIHKAFWKKLKKTMESK